LLHCANLVIFELETLNKCTNRGENCEQRCFRQFYSFFNNFVPPLHRTSISFNGSGSNFSSKSSFKKYL